MGIILACLIVTVPVPTSEANFIDCEGKEKCESKTKSCTSGEDCTISCDGKYACSTAIFNCPANYACTITCFGEEVCWGAVINAASSSQLTVNGCMHDPINFWPCENIDIHCPINVNGEPKCHISGNDEGILNWLTDNQEWDAGVFGMHLYAVNGWYDIDMSGYVGTTLYTQGTDGSGPATLHCTSDYSQNCLVEYDTINEEWTCEDTSSVCAPTQSPTTTDTPTTNTPTTNAPTTNAPTTNVPTTNAPTTNTPTTYTPTTGTPATESPITGSPTTTTTQSSITYAPTTNEPTTQSPTARPTTSSTSTSLTTTDSESSTEWMSTDNDEYSQNGGEDDTALFDVLIIFVSAICALIVCLIIVCLLYRYRKTQKANKMTQEQMKIKSVSIVDLGQHVSSAPSNYAQLTTPTSLNGLTSLSSNSAEFSGETKHRHQTLTSLLNEVGLMEYLNLFIEQGFGDDINQIKALSHLNDSDLQGMGIKKLAHRKLILAQIHGGGGGGGTEMVKVKSLSDDETYNNGEMRDNEMYKKMMNINHHHHSPQNVQKIPPPPPAVAFISVVVPDEHKNDSNVLDKIQRFDSEFLYKSQQKRIVPMTPDSASNVPTKGFIGGDEYSNSSDSDSDSDVADMYDNRKETAEAGTDAVGGGNGGQYPLFEGINQYKWIENALRRCVGAEWGRYFKMFKENEITDERLQYMDDKMWSTIFPEFGIRMQFTALYKENFGAI